MGSFDVPLDDERTQLDAFVEEYRSALEVAVDCLTEEEARRHLVSSATTLLGLLKHVTWMQRVWFEECVGGTSRGALGLVPTPEESFRLTDDDTVASVTAAHREACATARAARCSLWEIEALLSTTTSRRWEPRSTRWWTARAEVRQTAASSDGRATSAAHSGRNRSQWPIGPP